MADVAVVTNSNTGLPRTLIEDLDITVVSMYYDLGTGRLRESEFDGDADRFYTELEASKYVATTSPATVDDYIAVFERLLQTHNTVVSVLLTSAYSPTCANARQAAAQLESEGRGGERVVVIDSAGTGGRMGVQALAAARAAAAGQDRSRVIERVRRARQEVRVWVLVETLEYLRRGGKIGLAAAWLGSSLDLKSIITIESETKAVERVRTRKRGTERLVELMRQRRPAGADRWFVQHTNAHDDAQQLADRLAGLFGTEPLFVSEHGPVVAINFGPQSLWVGGLPGTALDGGRG
ncbi:DegV family protein [Mycobacterium gastri]|uniref:Fatty acid-binding protein DegV n=1 Tax=Mycobacterium gastri TaxID=1777 RepID=A0A1X1V9D7_MYCGS|nr:DegV family protein [Mycobacterium gastri]ETW26175.1 hypothetical protein MGAST_28850 [Mycobacterium gastri 'Wayne']ORV65675.1 hypothetical protein AWC07_13025 [Mycobacterium gastri]